MIDMMRKDAIELVIVELDKTETYPKEKLILKDGIYRYLYLPSEQRWGKKRRANDFIRSKNTHGLNQIVEYPITTLLLATWSI